LFGLSRDGLCLITRSKPLVFRQESEYLGSRIH
jgi:hypothetical protein